MKTTAITMTCPTETQTMISTLGPVIFGPDTHRRVLARLFTGGEDRGNFVGSAFCCWPIWAHLQSLFASTSRASEVEKRMAVESLVRHVGLQWDWNTMMPNTLPGNWNGHRVLLNPIKAVGNDHPEKSNLEKYYKLINTEIDLVLEWEAHITLVEAKVTSPLTSKQFTMHCAFAAYLEALSGRTVSLATLSRCKSLPKFPFKEYAGWISSLPFSKRIHEIAASAKAVTWDEAFTACGSVVTDQSSKRWFEDLREKIHVWDDGRQAFSPIHILGT